ncbi:hypothetical protein KC19_4G135000 [Ceratodon purpureus]|uniref:Uncharacterized protein n=1 Tax=Ceratodon purpureus TaxID=3225 RepID=A0A8T0IA93_CERPU|nr:hypothetical protein KC19_4G135000 [Ceratodon purpureus]
MTCVARCQLRHLERSWRSIEAARLIEATYSGSLRGGVLENSFPILFAWFSADFSADGGGFRCELSGDLSTGFCKCPREGHEELVVAIYLDTHLSVGPVDRTPWINHKL